MREPEQKTYILDLQIHNLILVQRNTTTRDRIRRSNASIIRSRSIFWPYFRNGFVLPSISRMLFKFVYQLLMLLSRQIASRTARPSWHSPSHHLGCVTLYNCQCTACASFIKHNRLNFLEFRNHCLIFIHVIPT